MVAKSKIDQIRDEILRIGAWTPDIFKPRLDVAWHFSDMVVTGKRATTVPFELLLEVFKTIPDGAGEDAFWKTLDATDFEALYERQLQTLKAEWDKVDRMKRKTTKSSKKKKKSAKANKS